MVNIILHTQEVVKKGTPCRKYWNGTFLLSKSPQLDVQKSTIMVSEVLDEVARSQPSRDH